MQQTKGVFYILKTAILHLTCLFGISFLFNKPKSICNGRFLKWHFLLWSLPLFYFDIIFDWYIFANWGLFIDSQSFQCTIEEMARGLPNHRRRYPLASEHRDRYSLFLLLHHHPPMMAVAEVEVNQTEFDDAICVNLILVDDREAYSEVIERGKIWQTWAHRAVVSPI